MDESEFNQLADAWLARIETELENLDGDFDLETPADGILEIQLDAGGKIIVNRHGAARELWVAARSGGFHYRWDGAAWRDTRSGEELLAALKRLATR
jgi:CyaY protein